MTLNKTTYDNFKEQINKELDNMWHNIENNNVFGGIECKIENGKLVHFKHWISRKI